ncbi:MAG: hypothetical protein DMG82_17205 [Acidobacteria bacterium]|nr:MAG: hypothetical protein DMG82_17205 [Acidobacteriota bacterium]PYX44876.1 MAG: hypothetical protein DMG83_11745 [Acidobacteriota bacterium]
MTAFGRFGSQVRARAGRLAQAGFGPGASDAGDGLTQYQFIRGMPLRQCDVSPEVLEKIATYCALRAGAFPSSSRVTDSLVHMARFNCREEFGIDPGCCHRTCRTNHPN